MFAYTGLKPEQMEQLAKEVGMMQQLLCIKLTKHSTPCMQPRTAEYQLLVLQRAT